MSLLKTFSVIMLLITLSSCWDDKKQFNGYIDADLIYLSSNYPGRIAELLVTRGASVQKRQALFKVEQTDTDIAIKISELSQKSTEEQKKQIINQLEYAELNYQRVYKMRRHDAASQNDLELAKQNLAVLKDQLVGINAQVQSSALDTVNKKWVNERKEGYANEDGIIFDTYFTQDEYVQPGQPIVSLLTPEQIKVVFFIQEPKLKQVKLNDKVAIYSGNQKIAVGKIDYIAKIAQYTPPIIYSREQNHNLVFRAEAHIDKPNLNQIHLGQPVYLELIT